MLSPEFSFKSEFIVNKPEPNIEMQTRSTPKKMNFALKPLQDSGRISKVRWVPAPHHCSHSTPDKGTVIW